MLAVTATAAAASIVAACSESATDATAEAPAAAKTAVPAPGAAKTAAPAPAVAKTPAPAATSAPASMAATPEAGKQDGSSQRLPGWSSNRASARIEVEAQVAISRTGLPTVGDTLIDEGGFETSLVAVSHTLELKQFTGSPFKPKNGTFKLVTVRFRNGTSSAMTLSKANIVLISPDGSETPVDNAGTNALTGMVPDIERGRPLYLVESLPAGKSAQVAVVFDVPSDWTGLTIEVEGFLFEVPDPDQE